ncbi:acetyl-CoA hydrolase/transferase C-terminal domain-containing protein [Motiliproteus sp. SC1-56]|uniref:acetyl-CoA hydrolase/transferase C-terminal domain-containing protein n=1 Tax=Motiliproteus sp. SC1-56 TaxID=2799565 RepID=UPI001A8FEB0D|nr:acetyl-CoA hydrolase/transferase C-terminal domain-containing protein [Motiliproteus sp. SC1-56]
MTPERPPSYEDPERLVDALIARLGKRIVLALPLGLGKANHLANALFDRALSDTGLSLTIFTALTLEIPSPGSELGKRFLDPIADKFFARYPPLRYTQHLRTQPLPSNIQVHEFFLMPGRWLHTPAAQRSYQCANYTQAVELLIGIGINLIGQLVATEQGPDPERLSFSCNPDLSVDLFQARAAGRANFVAVGQINRELPYMGGAAERPVADFDYLLDGDAVQFPLYAPPQQPVALQEHAIGLQVARLVPDGGTLQIGIGAISDAICHGLCLRHTDNAAYRALQASELANPHPAGADLNHLAPFETGLYGLSEMLVDGFINLIQAGVIAREVDGVLLHAGFFIGSPRFYRALEELPPATRAKIAMMPISFTNRLYPDTEARRAARRGARFVNSAMMATLLGAVVSDGLEEGKVVSGVGGQYNFAAMSMDLPGARSAITLPATRTEQGRARSNLRWQYGHCTLPRHLRDLLVTEYGVANLRGVSDAEVIARTLAITDSRFQAELTDKAKQAGKLAADYSLPERYRHNTPQRLADWLGPARDKGLLPVFPLGSDFSPTEERLAEALKALSLLRGAPRELARMALRGLKAGAPDAQTRACLERMQLSRPRSPRDRLYQLLLRGALS